MMEIKNIYSKEEIKDRMYKNAANFWGIRNIENLDPLVKLLIEAFASEIYKISNEQNGIEARILERVAHMLTPDILMTVRPAHMVLQVYPLEAKSIVNKMTGVYYDNPAFNMSHKVRNVSFYPVGSFPVIKGQVKSLICGRNVFKYDNTQNKEIQARSINRSSVFTHNIWIGLELDPAVKTLDNLSFFFDFINIENKAEYLNLLPYTKWEYQGKILKSRQGIYAVKEPSARSSIFTEYDLVNTYDNSVIKYYNHQYITITEEIKNGTANFENFPKDLIGLYPENVTEKFQTPLLWLKVSFPPNFSEEILDAITVSINAFPVINKNLNKGYFKINKLTNIIPLNTEAKEKFLFVNKITDSQGRVYEQLPYHDSDVHKPHTYSVKRGGVERFDSRNAKEYILNLMDLLRDEGVAYSLVGRGFLSGLTKQLEELITIMDRRVAEVNESRDISSYIVLDADGSDEIIFLNYWVTHADIVNNISAGAAFTPFSDMYVMSDRVFSLTTTVGGRGAPKSENVLDMYKYILTSRDRIYTTEDIINFCYSMFGDIISSIEVKKGVQVSSRPREGLMRTIDVFLQVDTKYENLSSREEFKKEVYSGLKEKSPDTFNYRIFINQ
ncbi:MAG: type VI secretion system baseplate subunit TssF [Prevotella sp.]|jgi:hypothetical protein|nr:type VI secretion system baseplate subunit TssF [Prevotella sp.]